MQQYDAVYQVSTINVGASGDTSVETFCPVKSNSVFERLSVTCVPLESYLTHRYELDLFIDGELEESRDYSAATDRRICHLSFPHKLFPPNIGANSIPSFFKVNAFDPGLAGVTVKITNHENERRTYLVYSTFIEYNTPRFVLMNRD